MRFTFPKGEKLKSRKQIELLFDEGNSLKEFPLRIRFLKTGNENNSIKVAFSVPKRNFKLAVHRIRLKRRLREAYRLNKHALENQIKGDYIVMFMYTDKIEWNFKDLERKMLLLFRKLIKEENKE